jgi:probable DNA metabolism protein
MIEVCVANGFEDWRAAARELVIEGVDPSSILWSNEIQGSLFEGSEAAGSGDSSLNVPREFVSMAETVACFDSAGRWGLLYRLLFRLVHENRDLLKIESDVDVVTANRMAKAVKRDIHKFHAFVRFRLVECETEEIYVAWHEPHHFTVERSVPFFARRFGSMKFSIFTPKGCAHWDLKSLSFSEPADRSMVPNPDEMEDFWLLYYRSIFNPFRLKVSAMKKEFPVRHWPTLPEAVLIPELIRSASESTT